ncbi:large subunit ribosomal protein L4 [Jatrophihabitans sp. GAS493]|nr:50S ribosomal protein L4 [Jatrophihabitans sp. GAS493]SOD72423.1 large subunit ribosomal protein L4 [Jatrophihabitans sp. GAS493]
MTATLTVRNPADAKAKTGTVELPAEIFDVPTNIPLVHQVVVAQLAAARQGTHATKTRAEVRGGGKKPYRQKGTGRARQGSTRAPQFVGGGVVHGPQPRSYAQRTPKKMIAGALRCALSDRARNDRIHVVTSLVGDTPSTKAATTALASVSSARNILVVAERNDDATWLSLRNHHAVHILEPGQLNTYDVLISDDIVFTEEALASFIAGPAKGKSAKGAASSLEADAVIDEKVDVATKAPKAPAKKAAKADTADATEAVEAKAKPAKKAAAKKAAAKTDDESATAGADAATEEEA